MKGPLGPKPRCSVTEGPQPYERGKAEETRPYLRPARVANRCTRINTIQFLIGQNARGYKDAAKGGTQVFTKLQGFGAEIKSSAILKGLFLQNGFALKQNLWNLPLLKLKCAPESSRVTSFEMQCQAAAFPLDAEAGH